MSRDLRFGWLTPAIGNRWSDHRPIVVHQDRHVLPVALPHFDSLWLADHFYGFDARSDPFMEAWTTLTWLAARHDDVMLCHHVLGVGYRPAALTAKMAATLQVLSGGRFVLGLGAGWREEEYAAYGYDFPRPAVRIAQLEEVVQLMRIMWTDDNPTFEGKHFQIKEAQFLPKPVQQPRIPVWVAGIWPNKKPFRRAAQWDGVMPGWDLFGTPKQTPQEVREMVAYIMSQRTTSEPFEVAHGGKTSGTDREADKQELSAYKEAGVTWWLEDLNPWRGPIEDMRERIRNGYVHV